MRKHVAAICMAFFSIITTVLPAIAAQNTDKPTFGFVGVVGPLAVNKQLVCPGKLYAPDLPGVFHPTAPCGSTVTLQNLQGDKPVTARVIGKMQSFLPGQRVVDITPELAKALNIDAGSLLPHLLWVTEGNHMPTSKPHPVPPKAPEVHISKHDQTVLAKNMYFEAADGGTAGMMAVARITLNLVQRCLKGKCTINKVVYNGAEFSWTILKKPPSYPNRKEKARALNMAERFLAGMISGNDLAATYLVGPHATEYYAHRLIVPPSWAVQANGEYCWVPMEKAAEDSFGHRFFRPASNGPCEDEPYDASPPTKTGRELYAGKLRGHGPKYAGKKSSRKWAKAHRKGKKMWASASKSRKHGKNRVASRKGKGKTHLASR